jgi:hypothetical protein
MPAKDSGKPSPAAEEPKDQRPDDVAPEGAAPSDLFLRRLHDALQDPDAAKNLEQRTNMTREQIEHLATKFTKPKIGPAGPGRDINVKLTDQQAVPPAADLPGINLNSRLSSRNIRPQGTMPQDEIRGMNEDIRVEPPAELRGHWEAFKNKLSKVTKHTTSPSTTKPAAK